MTQFGAGRNVSNISRNAKRSRWLVHVLRTVCIATVVFSTACYTFSQGGGFPKGLKTVAILPFDNLTATPEVQRELTEFMRNSFRERLSLRDATEEKADVIVRGTIGKYEPDLPAGISADPKQVNVSRRKLQLVIDVEIINQKTGLALLTQKGMQSEGFYAEGQEAAGRKLAIETIVDKMIQGTQSQW